MTCLLAKFLILCKLNTEQRLKICMIFGFFSEGLQDDEIVWIELLDDFATNIFKPLLCV